MKTSFVSIIGNKGFTVKLLIDNVSAYCINEGMEDKERARLDLSAEVFKAIGHPMRLAMLERLQAQPWCVCDLAQDLGLNKSIASKHLSQLYDVGLLEVEKKGTQVIYTLAAPCLVDMARCSHQAVVKQKLKRLQGERIAVR